MGKAFILAALLLGTCSLSAQSMDAPGQVPNPWPAPVTLQAVDRISSSVPRFGSLGHIVCDEEGNPVFHVTQRPGRIGPFLRIDHDGRGHVLFLPPSEAKPSDDLHWAVSPDGQFFLLFGNFRKPYELAIYKNDGSIDRTVATEIPTDVWIQHFAVNNQGRLFLQGSRAGDPNKPIKPGYSAILDIDGTLVKDLSHEAPRVDSAATGLPQGETVAGSDGKFYVLTPMSVQVRNAGGMLEKTLHFVKPDAESITNRVDYSSGLVSIEFYSVQKVPGMADQLKSRVLILDTQTGDIRGNYIFNPNLTGTILCFSRKTGYSMLAIDDNKNASFDIVPLQ